MTLEKLLAKARAVRGKQVEQNTHCLQKKVNQIQAKKSFSSKFQQRNSRTLQQAGFSSRQPFSKSYQQPQRPFTQQQPQDTRQSSQCRKCGLAWPHTRGPCPAQGQVCHKCNKPNHFARMCLAPQQPDTSEKNQQPEQKWPFNNQFNVLRTEPHHHPTQKAAMMSICTRSDKVKIGRPLSRSIRA